jgi:hypothetical protein
VSWVLCDELVWEPCVVWDVCDELVWEPCVVWVGVWAEGCVMSCAVMSWLGWCESRRRGGGRRKERRAQSEKQEPAHSDVGNQIMRYYVLVLIYIILPYITNVLPSMWPEQLVPKKWVKILGTGGKKYIHQTTNLTMGRSTRLGL